MSTKVQDVFERNPGTHLRFSCVFVCDDYSFEFSSMGSLGACLPRPHTFVCTGIALCGHPDSLSSLDSFSFQLSDELIAICRYRATFTDGHGHFCFCLYRAGAQVNLRTGIVAPLSGRDGMKE